MGLGLVTRLRGWIEIGMRMRFLGWKEMIWQGWRAAGVDGEIGSGWGVGWVEDRIGWICDGSR